MPGARHPDFRLGDRTELLAEFCLNTMAFTTRVPRQEDIGHDFFCVLSEIKQDMLWAGPSFTVKVKSNQIPSHLKRNTKSVGSLSSKILFSLLWAIVMS